MKVLLGMNFVIVIIVDVVMIVDIIVVVDIIDIVVDIDVMVVDGHQTEME